jgi:hypothetical protein
MADQNIPGSLNAECKNRPKPNRAMHQELKRDASSAASDAFNGTCASNELISRTEAGDRDTRGRKSQMCRNLGLREHGCNTNMAEIANSPEITVKAEQQSDGKGPKSTELDVNEISRGSCFLCSPTRVHFVSLRAIEMNVVCTCTASRSRVRKIARLFVSPLCCCEPAMPVTKCQLLPATLKHFNQTAIRRGRDDR